MQSNECGAVCLRMIAKYYGRLFDTEHLLKLDRQEAESGATLLGISEAAEHIGMHSVGAKLDYERLIDDIPLPGIVHWNKNHFVVVVEVTKSQVLLADPNADDVFPVSKVDFLEGWIGTKDPSTEGIILLMEPTERFYNKPPAAEASEEKSKISIHTYLKEYAVLRRFFFVASVVAALLAFVFPFMLRIMVDEGIRSHDDHLLFLILFAWVSVFVCQIGLEYLRHIILVNLGSKLNIRLVTSFMVNVMRMPMSFFRSRKTEDVAQILYENPKMQRFLSQDYFNAWYSLFIVTALSGLLLWFNWKICLIFLATAALQMGLVYLFLQKRKRLNYDRHQLAVRHYGQINDLFRGIRDIRLNNAEKARRWMWERSESRLYAANTAFFEMNEKSRHLPAMVAELRNITIIFIAALAVMNHKMTEGVMVAVIFILAQINQPLRQLTDYIFGHSEAKETLERMSEIQFNEQPEAEGALDSLPDTLNLSGSDISFRHEGANMPWVIHNLDFFIKKGFTTAIVGPSGSGKTTLLNLLLKFYQPETGFIRLGDVPLNNIQTETWVRHCGVVQQDGYIFQDSISRNIALCDDVIDSPRLYRAAHVANVLSFIDRFKEGLSTVIGEGGVTLSKGQRQCVLIARAIYKDPDFLFLDEATNDLDSESERIVLSRIQQAFRGKTIVFCSSSPDLPIRIDEVIPLSFVRQRPAESKEDYMEIRGGGNDNEAVSSRNTFHLNQ